MVNTQAGKTRTIHRLKLMTNSSMRAIASVAMARGKGITRVRIHTVPNEIIKTPAIRMA